MTVVCHLWPGITPFNVWDLQFDVWVTFARATDDYIKEQRKEQR